MKFFLFIDLSIFLWKGDELVAALGLDKKERGIAILLEEAELVLKSENNLCELGLYVPRRASPIWNIPQNLLLPNKGSAACPIEIFKKINE